MTNRTGVKARVIRVLSAGTARPFPPAIRRMSKGVVTGLVFALIAVSSVGAERIYKVGGAVTNPAVSQGVTFFVLLRNMTCDAFYTSKIGIADLQYIGNTSLREFPGCPPLPPES